MSKPEQKNVALSNDDEKENVSTGNNAEERQAGRVFLRDFHINNFLIPLEGPTVEESTGATIYSQSDYFVGYIYIETTNNRFHVSMEVENLYEYPIIQNGNPDHYLPFLVENLEISHWGEQVCQIDVDFYVSQFDESADRSMRLEFDVEVVGGDTYQKYLGVYLNAMVAKGES